MNYKATSDVSRLDILVATAEAVRDGLVANRGDIGELLKLRSSSVSEIVGHLVERDILYESKVRQRGLGRPAAVLSFNQRRLGAIFITVIDQKLVANVVDLGLRVLVEAEVSPASMAGNDSIGQHLVDLVSRVDAQCPDNIEICAVICSLSGVLDVPSSTWCRSSRWPEMQNLNLKKTLSHLGYNVFMVRNIDAELEGIRLNDGARQDETTLLLHWGHGIGASYASKDGVVNRDKGRFCEIGHWGLGNNLGRKCRCGNHDCLETVAALWAIGPQLAGQFPDLPQDEKEIAAHLSHAEIEKSPLMTDALAQVLRLTANLCRLLFPDRIFLTGPFVQNPRIFSRFVQTLETAPLLRSLDQVRVSAVSPGQRFEIAGALRAPFNEALRELM